MQWLKRSLGWILILSLSAHAGGQEIEPASSPTKRIAEWESLNYGMFIHFGLSTFTGNEIDPGDAPSTVYAPTNLDVRQWVRVAKEAGMKYIVLTAKHVDLGEKKTFDRARISEAYDRSRKFVLEYREGGPEDTGAAWRIFTEGTKIGKNVALEFEPVTARHVRLRFIEATGGPTVWEFELFPSKKK